MSVDYRVDSNYMYVVNSKSANTPWLFKRRSLSKFADKRFTNCSHSIVYVGVSKVLFLDIPYYGRTFSRDPSCAVFAVDCQTTKIKSAK